MKAAYDMTSYLIGLGHTQIGYVSESIGGIVSREERYQGYVQAMLEHGMPVLADRVFADVITESEAADAEGYRIKVEVLERLKDFLRGAGVTAVFCANDHVAVAVLNLASRMGIDVPGQLSIVGFTDLPIASQVHIPLTTVRKSAAELGKHAIDLLLRRMEAPQSEPEQVKLAAEIVVRNSAGRADSGS